jgi:hypothetical protein
MKFDISTKHLLVLYAVLIVLTGAYLVLTEDIAAGDHILYTGGRDTKFTFFDLVLILVLAVAVVLTIIATLAYSKKRNERLLFVAGAFFLFSIKAALKLIDNFLVSEYAYIGIGIQTLELLILVSLFLALFKK